MTIPHNIRSIAREAYKHWLYTGRQQSTCGKYVCHASSDGVEVVDSKHPTLTPMWTVPIAKTWLY